MKKILVVEDDLLVAATIVAALERQGFEVQVAHSGADALRLAAAFVPTLAVLDLRLPDISGIEVARQFRSTNTAFMVVSAYDDAEAVRCSADLGALAYLVKPLSLKQLVPMLETLAERAEEFGQLRRSRSRLQGLLDTGLTVATATGVVMERNHCDQKRAYEIIRRTARSERCKVRDTARTIIEQMASGARSTPDEGKPEPPC